jgi:protease-4
VKRSTKWFVALAVLLVVLGAALTTVAWLTTGHAPLSRREGVVLHADLEGAYPEHDPDRELNALFGRRVITLPELVGTLEAAGRDDRVLALQLRVGLLDVGWAKAREIREAILRFRDSGKPVVAFLEQGNDGSYYLASAADEVHAVPTSTLWLDGIRAEVPFYAGTLGKVGVVADLEQIGAYKNAADSFEREAMTPAHREAVNGLLDGLFDELVRDLAASRATPEDDVRSRIAAGPYTARQALDAGLVDSLGYWDEVAETLDRRLAKHDVRRLDFEDYLETRAPPRGSRTIAVVTVEGTILPGSSAEGVLGDAAAGSDTIAESLRSAWADHDAEAIVLRVDSPGGSPVASDVIWRAVERARVAGVPVVVSMSDVAASGGYWVAMGADRVVAGPSTITGSIGIYGGKYVTAGLYDKLALHHEPLERGRNAGINSSLSRYDDAQREWLQGSLDAVYQLFLEKTARGRGFPSADDVDRNAQGRVWTGRQARELGLVDQLGGLGDAIAAAKELAGIPASEVVTIRRYPRSPGLLELLVRGRGVRALRAAARQAVLSDLGRELPGEARALFLATRLLRQLQDEGVLAYMPYEVRAR